VEAARGIRLRSSPENTHDVDDNGAADDDEAIIFAPFSALLRFTFFHLFIYLSIFTQATSPINTIMICSKKAKN